MRIQCRVNYKMSYYFTETEGIGAPVPTIGGTFHYCQIHNPDMQFKYLQIRHRLKRVLYFIFMVLEHAARHAGGCAVFRICLNPFRLATLHC